MCDSLFKQAKCIPAAQEQSSNKDTQLLDAGSINVQENGKEIQVDIEAMLTAPATILLWMKFRYLRAWGFVAGGTVAC